MKTVSQAGGLVIRTDGNAPQLLIVKAKKNPQHWILPKGHIDPGESPEQTAVREVREEAGIETALVGPAGSIEFILDDEQLHVEYYLLEYRREVDGGEQREQRWCTFEEALDLLTFENTRGLLRDALPMIKEFIARLR